MPGGLGFHQVVDACAAAADVLFRKGEQFDAWNGSQQVARRLPNLVRGGWVERRERTLRLTAKGHVMALGTLASFKLFSLGMGGGVK